MINCPAYIKKFCRCSIALVAILLLYCQPMVAQAEYLSDEDIIILNDKINGFLDETTELMDYIESAQPAQIESIHRFADIINTRWKGFMLLEQENISQDDSLMVLVSDFEKSLKMLTDSISSREKTLELHANFVKAEKFLPQQIKAYEQMNKKANLLSLTPKTAAELEELKVQEQLMFAEIEKHYNNAKAAVERDPKLQKRMDKIEDEYIQLKNTSGEIQKAVYKPLVERVKDYLINLACVAILLMFLNIIATRIKAFKQARKAAKDIKKMMEKQNNDIPTI